jgi:hypothetical protein
MLADPSDDVFKRQGPNDFLQSPVVPWHRPGSAPKLFPGTLSSEDDSAYWGLALPRLSARVMRPNGSMWISRNAFDEKEFDGLSQMLLRSLRQPSLISR